MKIVLATNNAGKIREFSAVFEALNIECIPQSTLQVNDVEETGLSFVENAIIKARHTARVTKLPVLSDDSGLTVDALNGAPGIYSARFAGKEADADANLQKLLSQMINVSDDKRQAAFHCVLVFMLHADDPIPLICEGKWSGKILLTPTGTHGFGYDPIFFVPELNCSAAELPLELKNKISHRGQALQSLLKLLPEKLHESTLS